MSTPGLRIPHLSPSQSNKALSVNAALDGLDGALTQISIIDVSGSAGVTPAPASVLAFMCLRLIGIVTGNIHLILPSSGHLYLIDNKRTNLIAGATITIKCGSGTAVVLNAGEIKFVYCDGMNTVTPN